MRGKGGLQDGPEALAVAADLVVQAEELVVARLVEGSSDIRFRTSYGTIRHPYEPALDEIAAEDLRAGHGEPAPALPQRGRHPPDELVEPGVASISVNRAKTGQRTLSVRWSARRSSRTAAVHLIESGWPAQLIGKSTTTPRTTGQSVF